MDDNSLLVTLTKADLKQLIKDAISEVTQTDESKTQAEELLSPAQAIKIFNPSISKVSLHRWTKDGLIPVHRIRGRVYYKRSEVIAAALTVKKYDRDKLPA
jgi:hypothetical protein